MINYYNVHKMFIRASEKVPGCLPVARESLLLEKSEAKARQADAEDKLQKAEKRKREEW